MDPIIVGITGALASLAASFLTKYFSDIFDIAKTKIKIGDKEVFLSGDQEETLRQILEQVRKIQKNPQVFLSYSYENKDFANRLANDLREKGIELWIAENRVKVGDLITERIQEGINSSQWFIVILSENYGKSEFTNKELAFAYKEEKKRNRPFILPILIQDTEIPKLLEDRSYADFSSDYHVGLDKLLSRVKPTLEEVA
jgi:hypothetical protein